MKISDPGAEIHFRLLIPFSIFILQFSFFNFLITSDCRAAEGDPPAGSRAVISGIVTDAAGRPLPGASLRLERNGSDVALTRTDSTGSYRMSVVPLSGTYDLSATHGDLGDWLLNVPLREGDHKTINLTLKEAVSISGRVSTPDSAMADVPVQAILDRSGDLRNHPYTIAVTLTDKEGRYRFINLKPGRYQVWCVTPGEDIHSRAEKKTLQVERGKTLADVDFRLSRFKQRAWDAGHVDNLSPFSVPPTAPASLRPLLEIKTYTAKDGADAMRIAVADTQGYTWFRPVDTRESYFYRFDGRGFTAVDTVGPRSGSAVTGNLNTPPARDVEGKVWMEGDSGLVRLWNGRVQKRYTLHDGLPSDAVITLRADKHQGVWAMTTKGICYICEETGKDRVLVAVDSSMIHLSEAVSEAAWKNWNYQWGSAGMRTDSEGGVWWWARQSPDITTIFHRLLKTPHGISEAQNIRLSCRITDAWPVGSGLLLKCPEGPLIYFPAGGVGQPLDNRLKGYLGKGFKGRLYFTTRAEDKLTKIVRDEPDSAGYFGLIDSSWRFEFPMKLSDEYGLYKVSKVGNEMWVSVWGQDNPVVIRENDILPAKDVYSYDLTGGLFSADDETVWMLKWGKREVTELRFSKEIEYEVCNLNPNGLWPLQYNRKTRRFYFIAQGLLRREFSLMFYQNREWKELFKFPDLIWDDLSDIQENFWVISSARDSIHLICITADGDLEQQLTKMPGGRYELRPWSPDDRGGCYLLTSDSTLTYYKAKKWRTYPLTDIKDIRDIKAFADGSVYVHAAKGLYRWTPDSLRQLTVSDGLPADSLVATWKSFSKLFIRTARQVGWIENGKVSLVDTLHYPQLKNVAIAQQDRAGRMFFYGDPAEGPVREVWMLEGETLKNLPLPGSFKWFQPIFENGEVILFTSDSKIYRYSKEYQQFYLLKNAGDLFGYIWGGYITDGNLIVSGWGKHFLKIDLRAAWPTFPRLSFQTISINKKEVGEQDRRTLASGSALKADFIAIEKLDQTHVYYQTRLLGQDSAWSEPTKNESIDLRNLPAGTYRLEVRARGESELWGKPIGLDFEVLPPWYATAWAYLGYAMAFAGCLLGTVKITQRRLDRRRAVQEMEKELQTAHDLQMGMMSHEKPQIEGFDIAGCCLPANHVGGDFFKYFALPHGRVAGVLADVTGHAMEAAVPMLMFSGILESQMELGGTVEDLFSRLNRSLYRTLPGRTFVCLQMGELNPSDLTLRLSNSGCPYPYHYRASTGQVTEVQIDAYPLGIRPDTDYPVVEAQLQPGDRLVFCSDGVVEAANASGEQFGYERTAEAIRKACEEGLSAEATIDRLLKEVEAFRGNAPQSDDITCVVVRVEG